jgi:thiamine pyrophosphokinase
MPLVPCSGVTLKGVEWPLSNAELSPLGLISLSNRASGPIEITLTTGAAILFLAHPDLENPE